MKVRIQVIIESDNYGTPITDEVACIQRGDLAPEKLGLTLAEAKDLLANVQANIESISNQGQHFFIGVAVAII